jgi:hypothetical protein
MEKDTITPKELVANIDFPHKRKPEGKWLRLGAAPELKPGVSKDRLEFYAKKLLDLGMNSADISCLFSDLYWDSFEEAKLNKLL